MEFGTQTPYELNRHVWVKTGGLFVTAPRLGADLAGQANLLSLASYTLSPEWQNRSGGGLEGAQTDFAAGRLKEHGLTHGVLLGLPSKIYPHCSKRSESPLSAC